MKNLTSIQYNVIMQAINNAKIAIHDDEFIDPYGETTEGINNESCLQALNEVENMIISANIPFYYE